MMNKYMPSVDFKRFSDCGFVKRVSVLSVRGHGSSMVAARSARTLCLDWRVIECGLLSGLIVRHFQKPRAGMVISGLGPNLSGELAALSPKLVFPNQICSIISPIQSIVFSPPVSGFRLRRLSSLRQPQPSPDLDNLLPSSVRPKWFAPSCSPVRSRQASLACASTFDPTRSRPGWIFGPSMQCVSLRQ